MTSEEDNGIPPAVTQAADLKKLLQTIFEDGIVEPKEREALADFTRSMSSTETLRIFQLFLREKWGEVVADDIVTPSERRLLSHVMEELGLEVEDLPHQAKMALRGFM